MLTKVQTLRSSITGARPASGSQVPGVQYINFADLQLGVMNTSGDPQDLLAVRFYSEESNYSAGDVVVEGGKIWVNNGASSAGPFDPNDWTEVGANTGANVSTSDTPPSSPNDGDLWYNSSNGQLFVWYVDADSAQWVSVSGLGGSGGAGGGASVTTSDTAPVGASEGDLWFNSSNGQLHVYYNDGNSSQWVSASIGGGSGAVTSVNTQTGDVVLDYTDVGAAAASHTHTLPAPTASTLGGVFAKTAPAGQFVMGIDTSGNPTFGTPAGSTAPVTSVNTKTGAVVLNYTDVGAAAVSHTHTGTPAAVSYYNETTGVMSSANNAYWVPNGSFAHLSIGYKIDPNVPWPATTGHQLGTDGVFVQYGKEVGCLQHINNAESVNTFPTFTGFISFGIKEVFNPGGTNNSSVGHCATNNLYDFRIASSNNNTLSLGITDQNNGGWHEHIRCNPGGGIGINGGKWLGGGMAIQSSDGAYALAVASSSRPDDWWAVGPGWSGDGFFRVCYKGAGGNVYLDPNSTAWLAASDERVKDIIEPITGATEKVKQLRSVIGKYKKDAEGTRRTFLIAQDLLKVLPEVVDTHNPDEMGVDYTGVIPLLVAALKEQAARIESLEAMVGI